MSKAKRVFQIIVVLAILLAAPSSAKITAGTCESIYDSAKADAQLQLGICLSGGGVVTYGGQAACYSAYYARLSAENASYYACRAVLGY